MTNTLGLGMSNRGLVTAEKVGGKRRGKKSPLSLDYGFCRKGGLSAGFYWLLVRHFRPLVTMECNLS